jgi:hypothetical protein
MPFMTAPPDRPAASASRLRLPIALAAADPASRCRCVRFAAGAMHARNAAAACRTVAPDSTNGATRCRRSSE